METLVAAIPVFLASVVECVEAWTIVVAVGLTRGWRAPLVGVVAAIGVIGVLVAIFGVTIVEHVDEHLFEVVVGTLLLLFGLRWLRKAILRYSGVIALHDEDRIYREEVAVLQAAGEGARFDWVGFVAAFKAMFLEGLEITFLVITLGTAGTTSYASAIIGAAAAFVAVGTAGYMARKPLTHVPENTLKAFVGVMLCTFGVFWAAEGFGVRWAGDAWALLYLFAVWWAIAAAGVGLVRRLVGSPTESPLVEEVMV
jgi:uncharacterized membrane protein